MSQDNKNKINFFQRIDKIGDLFFLNILFVVSCVPIITIGAAFVALYSFTIKMVDNKEGSSVVKSYFKAFKDNFKQATATWLIILLILGSIYIEYAVSLTLTGTAVTVLTCVMAIEAVYLCFILPLIFPLIARYENSTANMFKNAFGFALTNLDKWFGAFFVWVLPIVLFVTDKRVLYYAGILWLVILVAVIAYADSMILLKLFEKLETTDDDVIEDFTEDEDFEKNKEESIEDENKSEKDV